jgi:cyanate permease
MYTAWGIAGTIGPILAGIVVDRTGAYNMAYIISAGLLAVCLVIGLLTKPISASNKA